ncbi:alpha1,3-fucosyltransferase, partial [Aphelenchoides avenae]
DVDWLASLPKPAFEAQKHVFFTAEAPINGVVQLWKLPKDYFHWTMTYLNSSDFASPYGGPWVPPEQAKERGLQAVNLTFDRKEILADKTIDGAFWLVSDCRTLSARERIVQTLSGHFRVDVGGKCSKDSTLRRICPPGDACEHVFRRYYFRIEAENANCNEYITEKYWRRFHLLTVPIVARRRLYEK